MATQWFRALFVVVFGCVTMWHCVGCELADRVMGKVVCNEVHLEDAGTSELLEELVDRGVDELGLDDLLFEDD